MEKRWLFVLMCGGMMHAACNAYPLLADRSQEQPLAALEEKELKKPAAKAPHAPARPLPLHALNMQLEDQLSALRKDVLKLQNQDVGPRFEQFSEHLSQLQTAMRHQGDRIQALEHQLAEVLKHDMVQPTQAKPAAVSKADASTQPAEPPSFEKAMAALEDKDHKQAAQHFKAYLSEQPDGPQAAQAYYWLGEIALLQGQYKLSEAYLLSVLRTHPQSPQASESLLKLAMVARHQHQPEQEKGYLQRCLKAYPDTTAARLAAASLRHATEAA